MTTVSTQYEYRIIVNNVPCPHGWNKSFDGATAHAHEMREMNPTDIITMEISPWYKENNQWHCPGCEYGTCPINKKREALKV